MKPFISLLIKKGSQVFIIFRNYVHFCPSNRHQRMIMQKNCVHIDEVLLNTSWFHDTIGFSNLSGHFLCGNFRARIVFQYVRNHCSDQIRKFIEKYSKCIHWKLGRRRFADMSSISANHCICRLFQILAFRDNCVSHYSVHSGPLRFGQFVHFVGDRDWSIFSDLKKRPNGSSN